MPLHNLKVELIDADLKLKKKTDVTYENLISEVNTESEKREQNYMENMWDDNLANEFNDKNPELNQRSLLLLRSMISDSDTPEEILEKVLNFYSDYSLADDALDFLLQTTTGDLASKVQQAKDNLNEDFGREVVAGKNDTRFR